MTCSPNFDALGDYEVPYECITALLSSNPKKAPAAIETTEDGAEDVETEGEVCRKKEIAQSGDAAATTTESAVINAVETATGPMDASSSSAPVSHADAGAATQSQSAADPASLEADPAPTAFDYSGLPDQTVSVLHLAEKEIRSARQTYICRVAAAVAAAHDELCGSCDNLSQLKHGNRGETTFGAWCASVGIGRKTAERLLQVNALLTGATIEEQITLEAASPSLLYAAAKPSAPAELVQAVKDGDITTHKQYREAMEEIRSRDAKIKELLDASEAADRRADDAQMRAREAQRERDGARQALAGAKQRGDRWREEAEKTKAELDALRAQPIQVTATLCAAEDSEQDRRDAYDAFVLAARNLETIWQLLRPQVKRLDPEQAAGAKNLVLQKLMEIKEELIHECKDRQP